MAKPIEALSIQLKFKDAGSQAVIEKLKGSLKRLELSASGAKPRIASLRKEILAQGNASVKSVANIQAQSTALKALRDEAKIGSRAFNQLTKDIAKLDGQMGKAQGRGGQRGMGARRATQAAGAVISGGIFGGPEGALGALGGLAAGGVEGAFAGAAIGAVVGGGRQALGETAAYAAQISKLKIALEGVAPSQDDFNFAVETAARATRELNVPQEQSIRGITRLTAAVTGAGGPVQDAATTFRNVTAAIKATGGSSEDVQGAITAMVQVFSKGKVSAEELSGQLGERLPGAVTLFAKANKMTLPELQKNLKAGTVGLNELMNFIRQLGDEFGGTAEKIAGSNEEAGARLNVAFNAMRLGVGQALMGTGSDLQNTFGNFIEEITPKVIAATEQLAKALKPVVKNLDLIVVSVVGLAAGAALGAAVKGFIALKAAIAGVQTVSALLLLNPMFGGALAVAGIVAGIYAITKAFGDQRTEVERLAAASRNIPIAQLDNKQRLAQITDTKAVLSSLRAKRQRLIRAGESEGGFDTSNIDSEIAAAEKRLQRLTAKRKTKDGKFVYDPVTSEDDDGDKSLARRIEQAQRLEQRSEAQLRIGEAQGAIGRLLAQQDNQRAALQARINKLLADGSNKEIERATEAAKTNQAKAHELELGKKIDALHKRAMTPLRNAVQSIKDKIKFDGRYKELLKQGINPERAKAIISIEKAFEKTVELLDAEIDILKAKVAQGDATEAQIEALDRLIKKRKEAEGERDEGVKGTVGVGKEPSFMEGLDQAIKDQEDALKNLINPLNQVKEAANAIGEAFKTSFKGIITGSMTAREALASFFQSIADHFADMAAQIAAEAIKLAALKFVRMIVGSMFGGGGGGASAVDASAYGDFSVAGPSFFAKDGAYVSGGFKAFNQGGVVSQPTLGMVGEGGESEYIIPQSKMRESMARYSRGVRGSGVIPDGAGATAASSGGAAVDGPIDVRYTVERINSVDYVTADQFQDGMRRAANQGAKQGEQQTLKRLQMSSSTRKRIGM